MRLKNMRRKQNLASDLGIEKKIEGSHAFFRNKKASILKNKKRIN